MTVEWDTPLTHGEARIWARRLRKIGFSPVTLHSDTDGWYLRCNWPYDAANLPLDLYQQPTRYDEEYVEVKCVTSRCFARSLLAQFSAVRSGMGSRPLPNVSSPMPEPTLSPVERLHSYFDWPLGTQRYPDYMP